MTVKANSVTSCPATVIEMPRSRARLGNSPTMMNSVVTITNAEIASNSTAKPCPADFVPGGAAWIGWLGDDIGKGLLNGALSTRDENARRAALIRA
ncbi:hypothetical protein [Sphingomonas sp. LR55]|uniref:hypothetical protein n=1 Tax=Sphingomonas sp. LR55 TaxID=3050231 RepID=UPI002FDF69B3